MFSKQYHSKSFSKVLLLIFIGLYAQSAFSQILFTKSFSVILDTNKRISGNFIPALKFQTQKENLFEFDNKADIAFKLKENVFTFANNIELSRYGKVTYLSGGYVYGEYRKLLEKKVALEAFSQVQWAEARGMEFKYAGGVSCRGRILVTQKMGLYVGSGPFYEYERWNYNGVKDTVDQALRAPNITNNLVKLGTYVSFKYTPSSKIFLDFSVYHQNELDGMLKTPRLASSSNITYRFTKNLGIALIYQNIYDYSPVVPITKLFNKVNCSLSVTF